LQTGRVADPSQAAMPQARWQPTRPILRNTFAGAHSHFINNTNIYIKNAKCLKKTYIKFITYIELKSIAFNDLDHILEY
jgi:hypothetical protein